MRPELQCRFCRSKDICNNGYTKNKKRQRYKCKNCNKGFILYDGPENESYVKCTICGQKFICISPAHLRLHSISMRQYKKSYPNAKIRSNLLRKELIIGINKYFSDPNNRKKLSKQKINWFKNNPMEAKELKNKIRKSLQTEEHKRIMSKSRKDWIKNHPKKWKNIIKKMIEGSKTQEIRQESSKRLKRLRKSERWNKIEEKRIKKLKDINFRKIRSRDMKRYFKEHPEAKMEQSKKMVKWIKTHPKEWKIVKEKSAITRSKPSFRKKTSNVVKRYFKDHPEIGRECSRRMKRLFNDDEWVRNWARKSNIKPNKPEMILITLLKEKNLPYEYVGDFKFMIGGRNPDFVNIDKKKVIELFGHFWHLERIKDSINKHINKRQDYFKKYGFDTLIIWDTELKDLTKVVDKIIKFDELKN